MNCGTSPTKKRHVCLDMSVDSVETFASSDTATPPYCDYISDNTPCFSLIDIFPEEILLHIFSYLPASGRQNLTLRAVCTRWNWIVKDPSTWQRCFVTPSHLWYGHLYEQEIHMRRQSFVYAYQPLIQPTVTVHCRAILVDWLCEIKHSLDLRSRVFYLAVGLLDRVAECSAGIEQSHYQCLGAACIYVAAKTMDCFSDNANDGNADNDNHHNLHNQEQEGINYQEFLATLVWLSDETYISEELLAAERHIMRILDGTVLQPTVIHFCTHYLGYIVPRPTRELKLLVMYLCEISCLDYSLHRDLMPSVIALAVLGYIDIMIETCTHPLLELMDPFQLRGRSRRSWKRCQTQALGGVLKLWRLHQTVQQNNCPWDASRSAYADPPQSAVALIPAPTEEQLHSHSSGLF